ncbi:MAG TPA: glycogen debranching N-terminal domain-containing protein [Oscillatoriaceae cyanobacterium]
MAKHEADLRGKHVGLTAAQKRAQTKKPQNFKTPAIVHSIADALVIKDWDLFFVVDREGNVPLKEGHGFGLYYHDCRYLRGYELKIDGQQAQVLASATRGGFKGRFELTNSNIQLEDGTLVDKETIAISWSRLLRGDNLTLNDEIMFMNSGDDSIVLPVTLSFRAEFEDVFNVRGLHKQPDGNHAPPRWEGDVLGFSYKGADGLFRSTAIHFEPAPVRRMDRSAHFHLELPPGEAVKLYVSLWIAESPERDEAMPRARREPNLEQVETKLHQASDTWLDQRTEVKTPSLLLERVMDRCLVDLHVLRSRLGEYEYFAAGIPWYGTLFGRDSLVTAYQTLAFDSGLAEQTLRLLAQYQGRKVNDWQDEEPGKILHEMRVGELARLDAIPFGPYYGSVDSTPLFILLVAEHAAWCGDMSLFRELKKNIEAALGWIDNFGDPHDWGYVTYQKKSSSGLDNQGWKDSGDAIVNADGSLAEPPIALVEVQGYVYMAKLRIADLYERDGDTRQAARLRAEAKALKERFNQDFWLEDLGCYALALQKDKRPCAVVASNMGQALWTGIIDHKRARAVADHLFAEPMYSGWGVRTLSGDARRYNPIGYHLGTVWPHDNSLIAMGLRAYGFEDKVLAIFQGIFEAATHFDQFRMPELFSGFRADQFGEPVRYPVACHPQAWAAGALPLLMRNLLGLVPDAFAKRLRIVRPILPDYVNHLHVRRLRVGGACVDLLYRRRDGGLQVTVTHQEGELKVDVED